MIATKSYPVALRSNELVIRTAAEPFEISHLCANRLKLVVQLRRFVIMDENRRPNLASQCLGRALPDLPVEWHRVHGFRPRLPATASGHACRELP